MSTPTLCRRVTLVGFLSVTLIVALCAHSILEFAQSGGLLSGDYGQYSHGAIFPVALVASSLTLCGVLLYLVHLLDLSDSSLPLLALALRQRIDWRAAALSAGVACLVLLAMETSEQSASGSFDGVLSAFSGVPLMGLGIVLFVSAICNAVAWLLCDWLAKAHARLVLVIAFLIAPRAAGAGIVALCLKRSGRTTSGDIWEAQRAHPKRGPPCLAS